MLDMQKSLDCVIAGCVGVMWVWIGDHWIGALGAALLIWRCFQAFVLEPLGIFWPSTSIVRRRNAADEQRRHDEGQ